MLTGPVQTAHVPHSSVDLREGLEGAADRIGHHDEQRQHPGGGDDAVGVGAGLPGAGLQRVTDGAVSLDGNGHKAEGGDADGDACRYATKTMDMGFSGFSLCGK